MSENVITEERQPPGTQPETEALPPTTVESTLVESVVVSTETPPLADEEQGSEDAAAPRQKRVFVPNWSTIIACVLFLLLVGEHVVPLVWPMIDAYLHPKATVTLFAAKQPLTFRYTFLAVTGIADQSQQQIPSRLLSFTTPTKQTAIRTTGVGYTPAVQAKGEITFYNEAPYAQTIRAGTVVTGHDNIQIVTDQAVTIAAGNGGTNGSATVAAHTIQAGTTANIPPLAINGLCCLGGILAKNMRSFTGGLDPRAYPVVSSADLAAAARQLAGVLDPQARNALQSQVVETERPLTPLQCRYNRTSEPKVGEKATQARISVSETCTVQVYNYVALQELTRSQFLQDVRKMLGWEYELGESFSLTLAKPALLDNSHRTYTLAVTTSGTMIFHLSATELHSLVQQIAGKKITEAQHQLLTIKGVQGVSITPAHPGENTLPTDPSQIQIVIA
jgi:hypothetical protein